MSEELTLSSWDREGLINSFPMIDAEGELSRAEKWLKASPKRKPERLIAFYQAWLERALRNKAPKVEERNEADYTTTVEQAREMCQGLLRSMGGFVEKKIEGRAVTHSECTHHFCDVELKHEYSLIEGRPCYICGITMAQVRDAARISNGG